MALQELNQATTTDFTNQVPNFIVESKALDVSSPNQDETYVYFDKAPENFGYYLNHPQVSSPINSLNTWAFGRGWTTEDKAMQAQLEHVTGDGKDTFDQIIWNHGVVMDAGGDSFTEVKKGKSGVILNMIPISPERVRVVYGKTGLIKRYDAWNGSVWKPIKKENMLHSRNKRIGDQNHGTSTIQSNKNVNDAMIEAFEDERLIKHRDKALGIVYYKTSNTGKITFANTQIEKAVSKGEMLGLPEDTAKIEPYPSKSSEDRQNWLQYVENLGYQTGGVPRAIVTSDGTSEVGGKMGHVIFEPIYAKKQRDMEADLLLQHSIKILFNRPPSLGGLQQETEAKNTGQTSIQPNDVEASLTRE